MQKKIQKPKKQKNPKTKTKSKVRGFSEEHDDIEVERKCKSGFNRAGFAVLNEI